MPEIAQRGFTWIGKRYAAGETVKAGEHGMTESALAGHRNAGRIAFVEEDPATDAAAKKAEELGVDITKVTGTGEGGRVTVPDVEAAAKEGDG